MKFISIFLPQVGVSSIYQRYKKMRRLSQAPAFCYKIQIQLNEIYFFLLEILNHCANICNYFKESKFS